MEPGGLGTPVKNENRQDFVRLTMEYYLTQSVKEQYGAFAAGFLKVCLPAPCELLLHLHACLAALFILPSKHLHAGLQQANAAAIRNRMSSLHPAGWHAVQILKL